MRQRPFFIFSATIISRMKKIFIIGGSSLVGSHLLHYLSSRYRVWTSYHKSPIRIPDVISMPLDLANKESVEKIIHVIKPDVVIYAAANNHLEWCQNYPRSAELLNNQGPVNLSYACEKRQIKLVLLSSCFVFSGENAPYREKDQPKPLNAYGNSMTAAEYSIQKNCTRYLILRCSPIWGRSVGFRKQGFFDYIEYQLARGEVCRLDDRIRTGMVSGYFVAKVIYWCLEKAVENRILQLNSKDYLTQYEFGQLMLKHYGAPSNLIVPYQDEFPIDDSKKQFVRKIFDFSCAPDNLGKLMKIAIPGAEEQLLNYIKHFSQEIQFI